MSKAAEERAKRAEAQEQLRGIFPAGTVVSVARLKTTDSGQTVAVLAYDEKQGLIWNASGIVARAGFGRWDERTGAVRMGGGGMDLGAGLVSDMAYVLHGDSRALGCGRVL